MDPVTISLVISGILKLIEQEPQIASTLQTLFAKGAPTDADFAALRARVEAATYEKLVPHTQLK